MTAPVSKAPTGMWTLAAAKGPAPRSVLITEHIKGESGSCVTSS
eukprot:CAMPEP_0172815834 /NCGR_PEP_ID=MMETSP1075-20121228/12023_1 /TAXON_ID=2916 /ORGANISM="Ceratium fusus, Strain PA161109" /LENGTH=43 /DNA_ID= /DNA_START= /DNA_END= /DNA_ORIENTATION=